jgi:hypothetical protein
MTWDKKANTAGEERRGKGDRREGESCFFNALITVDEALSWR